MQYILTIYFFAVDKQILTVMRHSSNG